MWRNNITHVNRMLKGMLNKIFIYKQNQHHTTYPHINHKIKKKYGLRQTLNGLFTYSHP